MGDGRGDHTGGFGGGDRFTPTALALEIWRNLLNLSGVLRFATVEL